jgi:predicted nucleotidyltransferase
MTNEVRIALCRVCSLLNDHQVEYLIIGGTAVGVYGYNRISGGPTSREEIVDIDFWYNPTIENFYNLIKVLEEMDIQTESLKDIVFDPAKTFLRIPHQGFQTEFLPNVKGLDSFKDCKKRAKKISLDGNDLLVIGYDDLILNKKAVNRPVDQSDILELKRINEPPQNSK